MRGSAQVAAEDTRYKAAAAAVAGTKGGTTHPSGNFLLVYLSMHTTKARRRQSLRGHVTGLC